MEKSRRNLILVALALLAGLAAWFAYDAWQTSSPAITTEKPISTEKLNVIQKKSEELEAAKETGDKKKIQEAEQSLSETIGGRAGKMLRMAQDRNLPIDMYGKVIDQHGRPVDGAEVYMVVAGGGTFAPGSGPVKVWTDAAGIFRLQAKGQQMEILHVKHPNLAKTIFNDAGVRSAHGFLDAVGRFGEEYSWRSYATPDNPFVIHVWRVEEFGSAKKHDGIGFFPIPNGNPYEYAEIEVTCKRDQRAPNTHWREQKGSWSITFRPINGGIQETNDLYLNEAPESGYQPELTVAMQRGDPDYKVNIQPARHYYYTANNGELYGAFSATFEPYMYDEECRVNADIKYNQTGSRNLAIKPK